MACCVIPVRNVLPFNLGSTQKRHAGVTDAICSRKIFAIDVLRVSAQNWRRRRAREGKTSTHKLGKQCVRTIASSRTVSSRGEILGPEFAGSSRMRSGYQTTFDAISGIGPGTRISAEEENDMSWACDTKQRGGRVSSFQLNLWLLRHAARTAVISVISASLCFGGRVFAYSDCSNLTAYYAPSIGLKGQVLKSRLHEIIKDHKVVSYIQAWDALKVLDEAEDDPDSVIEIYSLKKVAKSQQAEADGWNREHLWPRSYGLVIGHPEFSDLQNLRPADVNVNSSRGNKSFGECTTSDHCLVPANREAAVDTGTTRDLWMPPAQVRGDIARALMYMAVRYGGEESKLQLSDSPSIRAAQMGFLSDILHWNEMDPPSPTEKLRNGLICQLYQHNRNPFVDHPEFAKLIWGDAGQDGPLSHAPQIVDHKGKRQKH